MKAVVWDRYGGPEVLKYTEVDTPQPKENEILIKIHATTVTLGDCEMRGSYLPMWTRIPLRLVMGVFRPRGQKILGQECAGEVVKVGSEVTKYEVGDRVVVIPGLQLGGYAQYMTIKENPGMGLIVKMHPDISYEHATTLPVGGINGKYFIDLANISEGQEVLINGAAGSIGSYAIQIAKLKGAEVTAIDLTEKFPLMKEMGADHVIDFTKEDFTRSDKQYDVIFDIVGKASFSRSVKAVKSGGYYITANPMINTMIRSWFKSKFSDKTVIAGIASESTQLLEELMQMVVDGKLQVYIDKSFKLDEMIEAHHYIESNKKQGNVVVEIDH